MARATNEANSCSKIALSTLSIGERQILIRQLESSGVKLPVEWEVGLPIPIEHLWQIISHNIGS